MVTKMGPNGRKSCWMCRDEGLTNGEVLPSVNEQGTCVLHQAGDGSLAALENSTRTASDPEAPRASSLNVDITESGAPSLLQFSGSRMEQKYGSSKLWLQGGKRNGSVVRRLNDRELWLLILIGKGVSDEGVAKAFGATLSTVRVWVPRVYKVLEIDAPIREKRDIAIKMVRDHLHSYL